MQKPETTEIDSVGRERLRHSLALRVFIRLSLSLGYVVFDAMALDRNDP